MIRFPNAKINLGLYITHKRDDGYHNLETVFYPVPISDALEIIPADKTQLHLSGHAVAGNNEDNLVWKAFRMLQAQFPGKVAELDIYLHKTLPMGAGLGGGSADGAFMLALLNDYFSLGLDKEQLAAMALQLGSDCPFFIYNTPQFARGRGEVMEPVSVDLSGFSIQLICPGVHVSTGKAFGMITPRPAPFDLGKLSDLPVVDWKDHISNDFEASVFAQHSELADIKQQLYSGGAVYASMSGSGSSIYGLFPKTQKTVIVTSLKFEQFYIE